MATITHEGVGDNLRFLVLEVRKQVERTQSYLADPSPNLVESVLAKDDYIDNLKDIIQRKCFALASEALESDSHRVDQLKAIDQISVNLERIADFCENILSQVQYITDQSVLRVRDFSDFFTCILSAIDLIQGALFKSDVQMALKICRAEYELDRRYGAAFRDLVEELEKGENVQSLVTVIFIYRYLERMGDSLQNIGEAVISYALGEKIKIDRFWALEDSLGSAAGGSRISEIELEPVGETRSGCKISRVHRKSSLEGERQVIFKEGRLEKLIAERESIERWQQLMPGLVPQIYSFHEQGDHASILFEYITGQTFEELLLRGEAEKLTTALDAVCSMLRHVWSSTRKDEPVSARFLDQLSKRLPDVYAVHPGFKQSSSTIGTVPAPSFAELIAKVRPLDNELLAPFSVFIHGDFNVDNIIYDDREGCIHLIDVYRSRLLDYVQDVSVFMVSNLRLQVFEAPVRRRINSVVEQFLEFCTDFARSENDTTFQARLALGLARSFATSARFVLDRAFAKSMFLRGRYLIECLIEADRLEEFTVPREVLVD